MFVFFLFGFFLGLLNRYTLHLLFPGTSPVYVPAFYCLGKFAVLMTVCLCICESCLLVCLYRFSAFLSVSRPPRLIGWRQV